MRLHYYNGLKCDNQKVKIFNVERNVDFHYKLYFYCVDFQYKLYFYFPKTPCICQLINKSTIC